MTTNPPILRDSLLVLPVLVVVASWIAGLEFGAEVAFTGLVAIGNLALLARLATGFVSSLASEHGDGGMSGIFLGLKLMLTVPVFVGLMWLTSPIAVSVGMFSVVAGLSVRGLVYAIRPVGTLPSDRTTVPTAGET